MPAVFGADTVRSHDHRHGIPAYVGLDASFERPIARILGLAPGRDRVQVGRIRAVRQVGAGAARKVDHFVEQEVGSLRPVTRQHRIDRFQPLAGLHRINVVVWIETRHRTSIGSGPLSHAIFIA